MRPLFAPSPTNDIGRGGKTTRNKSRRRFFRGILLMFWGKRRAVYFRMRVKRGNLACLCCKQILRLLPFPSLPSTRHFKTFLPFLCPPSLPLSSPSSSNNPSCSSLKSFSSLALPIFLPFFSEGKRNKFFGGNPLFSPLPIFFCLAINSGIRSVFAAVLVVEALQAIFFQQEGDLLRFPRLFRKKNCLHLMYWKVRRSRS